MGSRSQRLVETQPKGKPQSRVTDSILQSLMLLHNIKVCQAAKNFHTQIIILGVKIIIIWHAENR